MILKLIYWFFGFSVRKYRYPIPRNIPVKMEKCKHVHGGSMKHAIDFFCPESTPVFAASDGEVIVVSDWQDKGGPSEEFAENANYICIKHKNELSFYYHLKHRSSLVQVGHFVHKGKMIARQGSTGYTTEPHIHFLVYRGIKSVRIRFEERKEDN